MTTTLLHPDDDYPTLTPPDTSGERVYSESEAPGPRVDIMARRKARPEPTPEQIKAKQEAYDSLTGRPAGNSLTGRYVES